VGHLLQPGPLPRGDAGFHPPAAADAFDRGPAGRHARGGDAGFAVAGDDAADRLGQHHLRARFALVPLELTPPKNRARRRPLGRGFFVVYCRLAIRTAEMSAWTDRYAYPLSSDKEQTCGTSGERPP